MQIDFKDKKLRNLCEKHGVATKRLGAACAGKLKARLSDLEAARRVSDLVAGHPHPLKGEREGQFALDLTGGFRLVFSPNNDPCPRHSDGTIAWSEVTIISIDYIGDYHD